MSLAGLRGFLAAARASSFTRAADELHLSQSALSRQIQGLEDELGARLFVRGTRVLGLTPAGERLARAAAAGLRQIDECVAALRLAGGRRQVALTTFASFASLWLIPRLHRFGAAHPDVDVNCMATDRLVDLDGEGVDVALRSTPQRLTAPEAERLFDETMIPVCSPALLASGPPPRVPADLAAHTLLRHDAASEALMPLLSWDGWAEAAGVAPPAARSELRFSNHDQIIQATLAAQGVALARTPLVVELLADGRLVPLFGGAVRTEHRYYVITSRAGRDRPEIRDFVAWVVDEARRVRPLLERFRPSSGRGVA